MTTTVHDVRITEISDHTFTSEQTRRQAQTPLALEQIGNFLLDSESDVFYIPTGFVAHNVH
jgi:hypothetical protein